jgi:flagellar motor switch/type III secretory pathway protein FliN
MTVTTPRPYPWQGLEPYRRADLEAWRHIKHWAETSLGLERCLAALEVAIGTRVVTHLRDARRGFSSPPFDEAIAIDLEAAGSRGGRVLLEVEAPLATALTARALKRAPPRIHAPLGTAGAESLAGSLAALVSAVGRRIHASPLRVRAVGPSAGVRASADGASSFDTATFTVVVDDEAYLTRVSLRAASAETGAVAWNREKLKRLGRTPIGIPVVACSFVTSPTEVAALGAGDAWMLGDQPRLRSPRADVWLAAPDAEFGICAELVEKGCLVLRGRREELGWSPMIEPNESDALVDAVGDVPIVVRVEVGTVRMTAREWADLTPGDVVGVARRVGDPVTLRVSGVEVARGELVDVEGEIGVRVLSRQGEEHAR